MQLSQKHTTGILALSFGESTYECLSNRVDLLQALLFDTPPIFSWNDHSLQETNSHTVDAGRCTIFSLLMEEVILQSAVEWNGPHQFDLHYSELWNDLQPVLDDVRRCFDGIFASLSIDNMKATCFLEHLEAFHRHTVQVRGLPSCTDHWNDVHLLGQASYHCLTILYNVLINRIAYQHPNNQGHVDALCKALNSAKESNWTSIPHLRIWMLLTGITASRNVTRKSFFKSHLLRLIYALGMPNWERTKEVIIQYLDMRYYLHRWTRGSSCIAPENGHYQPIRTKESERPVPVVDSTLDEIAKHTSHSVANDRINLVNNQHLAANLDRSSHWPKAISAARIKDSTACGGSAISIWEQAQP